MTTERMVIDWIYRSGEIIREEFLGPWGEHGYAWEHAAAFIAWAIERHFEVPRGAENRLEIYDVELTDGQRCQPTINVVFNRLIAVGTEHWKTDLKDIRPWEPNPRARSQSGTGDEYWNDIVAAARRHAYPLGRPMVHGLWTVSTTEGSLPQIVPDEARIAELEATFPAFLARMS